ncbi:MAG: hypothetical protein EBR02_02330 [Alphaproteobacteria bacterium]|nr:hypothetical protein [Alphaproteobacteria bacterium]
MTNSYPWAEKERYSYLTKLDKRHQPRGWAWEFIRRSQDYRNAYKSFLYLQEEFGADWIKKQSRDVYEPPLLSGESERKWYSRGNDQLFIAQKLTASQKCARQWQLHDMYDPTWEYNGKAILFVAEKQYPMFYGDKAAIKNPQVNSIEDLQNDLVHLPTTNILYVALDTTQPLKYQLPQLKTIFANSKKLESIKKGQSERWMTYIQFLDALDSGINIQFTHILKAIKHKGWHAENLPLAASECREAAQKMANEGYKGLLRQIQNG